MCWCDPEVRTPCCGKPGCHPPGHPEITSMDGFKQEDEPKLPSEEWETIRNPSSDRESPPWTWADDMTEARQEEFENFVTGWLDRLVAKER